MSSKLRRAAGLWLLMLAVLFPAAGLVSAADEKAEGFIVFAAGDGRDRNIMFVPAGGGLPKNLAEGPELLTQPAVGPGGRTAWIRQVGVSEWELVENGQTVSRGALHLSPAYRPDGVLTAAVSEKEETSLYAFEPGGRRLLVRGGQDGFAVSPTFSPDGGRMAYAAVTGDGVQVYTAAADGSGARLLTSGNDLNTDPVWSPAGDLIAFVAAEKRICLVSPDGGGLRVLNTGPGQSRSPSFSPDGRRLVFSNDRDGQWRLYVISLSGGAEQLLLPGFPAAQHLPVWSAHKPAPAVVKP